ncbi:hypothetical protein C3K47_18390 [Solitalea longa]|uniref:LTD domain-containing protein n=1 Tax=Solitalea longa TaxID=2079460 RepID=A0A2S4ZWR7_9SPHI|nr:lamin tail domain-containing protein [Solitalea longa]POY34808.1 hypothetical protein C3K47_18390 [Solitalea longa]
MKNILCILLSFLYMNGYSQLKDSFSDNDLSSNPQWNGNLDAWFINSDKNLQTKRNSASATVYLSSESNLALNSKWTFSVKLSFNPSGSNQARVYIISDQSDLTKPLNGYFIQIGENGSTDSYDLFRQTGTTVIKIIDGPTRPRKDDNMVEAEIEISRNESGFFELKTKIDDDVVFTTEGSATDLTHKTGLYFGFVSKYTSTRSDQFYFDNVEISELIKPKPVYAGKAGDMLFTELFPDPSPQVDLPTSEFVEIYNMSDSLINLKNWTYSDATTTFTFKSGIIQPKTYLIICPVADTANYNQWGKSLGLSPWPSLNNSGDLLTLKNAEGTVIDQVEYNDEWYRDAEKKWGGFTLERNQLMQFCTAAQQWKASVAADGGTPGKANSTSVANQNAKLKALTAELIDSVSIAIRLSDFADSASFALTNIAIEPGVAIKHIELVAPYFDQINISLNKALISGLTYSLFLQDIKDCFGNSIDPTKKQLLRPHIILPGDILINEVLFNPKPDGVDFVEIINRSEKILDLRELELGTINSKDTLIFSPVSNSTLFIHPGEIKAFTVNTSTLKQQYFCKNEDALIELKSMPAYNNDKGSVVLRSGNTIIDRFDYTEKMHFALINNPEGVSLERIDVNSATNQPGNFHSAASMSGFATPGYENSQSSMSTENNDEINLSSTIISPDNDGMDDLLSISYRFNESGLMANISIFNRYGDLVRKLSNNELLGTEGSITWDGLDQHLQPVITGPYMIIIETYNTSGKVKVYKKSVVVAQKFN